MGNYLTSNNETEFDYSNEHTENDEEEAAVLERMAKILEEEQEAVTSAKRKAALAQLQRIRICSCGAYTCPLTPRFGTPVPTFKEDIQPLYPQSKRDKEALAIRAAEKAN